MNIIEAYLNTFDNFAIFWKILIQVVLIFLFVFCLSKLIKYALFILFKYSAKTKNKIDNKIIVTIKKPILFLIWLYGFIFSMDLIIDRISKELLNLMVNFKFTIIYMSVLVFLLKSVNQIKRYYIIQRERNNSIVDYTGIDLVEKISKVTILIVWSIIILGKLGFNLNALLAFGGAGGIIVGFAGKDLFANIFGGLIVYLDKPFVVGDWIASSDKEIEGEVESIGWRQTRILTFEKYPIYVPNYIFGTIVIKNKSRIRSRRINEQMNIRYLDIDKINKITTEIIHMLKNHSSINKKYDMFVNFTGFNKGMLTLTLYTYTNTTEFVRFFGIKQDVLLRIADIIRKNGAEIAFTPNTLYMNKGNEFGRHNIISASSE